MNSRSCCHFNASGVFSPSEGGSDVLSLPSLSLSVCVYVFVEEKKKKRVNVIMKFMCACVRSVACCVCTTYVTRMSKRCLCASRRHLRALWESRVNDASMIFCRVYDTHINMLLLLLCFHLLLKSAKKPSPSVNASARLLV